MLSNLMPREGKFFDFFNRHADLACEASRELLALLGNLDELERRRSAIERCEKEADKVTHDCIELMHTTFITPLDRDQIHTLITTMDDILDLMEDTAQTVDLYDLHTITPEMSELAKIGVDCVDRVRKVVGMLDKLSQGQEILRICQEIDRLETDADHVLRKAMAALFRTQNDARELIKMKTVYELLESVTDRAEDVANIVEGIVLENA